jgi:type IV pilus assembly protein PilN
MIRINLLPVQQDRQRQYGKQQFLVGVVLLMVELVALYFVHGNKAEQLEEREQQLGELQTEITALREATAQNDQLNQQKESLQQMASVLEDLEANRAGPVQVLDEMKLMLNAPSNELERVSQEVRRWNLNWSPTNLWLTDFREVDGAVVITGHAITNDDIAEFNTRLATSVYFSGVRLNSTRAVQDPQMGRVFSFTLTARVNYGIVDEQG